jgi:hypothetical protein
LDKVDLAVILPKTRANKFVVVQTGTLADAHLL